LTLLISDLGQATRRRRAAPRWSDYCWYRYEYFRL